jgi:hypothetical protein
MAEQQRAFKGVWIPAEIWLNESLSLQEKAVLAEIDSFCSYYDSCYASNEHFAKFIGVSTRRIQDIIKALEDKHLIEREVTYKQGTKEIEKRFLRVRYPSRRILHGGGEESFMGGGEENCADNNTSMNNTKEDIYIGAKPHRKRKSFIPPSLEEVEAYIAEKEYSFNAKAFMDYYEASDWHKNNGKKVANWKKCCATWENNATKYVVSKQKKQPTQADYDEWIKELEEDEIKQG